MELLALASSLEDSSGEVAGPDRHTALVVLLLDAVPLARGAMTGGARLHERWSAMNITHETPVGAIVAERLGRAHVFERLGIDYCCHGATPLVEA